MTEQIKIVSRFDSNQVLFTFDVPEGMESGMQMRAALEAARVSGANLSGANLYGANLYGAKNAELAIARTRIVGEGSLIGWKKCQSGVIVKLRIPEEAKRSHAWGRKCRAEIGKSQHDNGKTLYKVGERVTPDGWCDDYTQECAAGIHFFINRLEAENYV